VVSLSRFTTGSSDEPTAPGLPLSWSHALSFGLGVVALGGSALPLRAADLPATEAVAPGSFSTEIVATASFAPEKLAAKKEATGSTSTRTPVTASTAVEPAAPQTLAPEPASLTADGPEAPADLEIAQALAPQPEPSWPPAVGSPAPTGPLAPPYPKPPSPGHLAPGPTAPGPLAPPSPRPQSAGPMAPGPMVLGPMAPPSPVPMQPAPLGGRPAAGGQSQLGGPPGAGGSTAAPSVTPIHTSAPPAPGAQTPATAVPPPLELELSADRQEFDNQLQRFVGTGSVRALIGGGRLLADRIEYDPTSRTIYAFGSVRFQRGQQYLQASRLRFSLDEGVGDMDDVYGVLDLDSSSSDLTLVPPTGLPATAGAATAKPTNPDKPVVPLAPLTPPEPITCPPAIPAPPQWHPHPWAVTTWTGQMFAANFGDTFLFKGHFRPEYLAGVNLQRRLVDAGPFALEIDSNLLGHRAAAQAGGEFNQTVPFGRTPAQTFGEGTIGIGMRFWVLPRVSLFFVEGVSLLSEPSNYERTFRQNYATFLNYLAFEVEGLVTPQWSVVGRIHHRSGAYGTYSGVSEGSNAYLVGLRYRFGHSAAPRQPLALVPAQGCAQAPPPESVPVEDLASQLERVTMGVETAPTPDRRRTAVPATALPSGSMAATADTGSVPTAAAGSNQNAAAGSNSAAAAAGTVQPAAAGSNGRGWQPLRRQERARDAAIAKVDQRVSDVSFQQSLSAERRYGFPAQLNTPGAVNNFGAVHPTQLDDLTTSNNRKLVQGTISRWRLQARQLRFTAKTFSGDRVGFTNDPFTPAQSWLDSENVVATLMPNGDTVIKAQRNHLRLENRLGIRVTNQTRIKKQQEVENRWVLGVDKEDRDGWFVGYRQPFKIGENRLLSIEPQFMLQRAIKGNTNAYPLPGEPAGAPTQSQPIKASDLVGLQVKYSGELAGFESNARLEMSTFNPENIPDGTRSWVDLARGVSLPLLGPSTLRLFGAYRFRVWNGTLGEQNVYSAYGMSFERTATLPNWGKLGINYFWRFGGANIQASPYENPNLLQLWRTYGISSINLSYPLWTGKAAPLTPTQGLANTAVPVVPGLRLNMNVLGTLAYYGDGTNQNTLGFSAGPTLTLGHFVKPWFDYTELTVTGGGTLKQGNSPFGFDRAVDLGTVGVGLTQQIAGPLVFSGGVGFNVDGRSGNYGEITNSYIEFRWQRRSYQLGVFYSPYNGLGGIRVKLNDFNFKGPGLPFVPYEPAAPGLDPVRQVLDRPF